MTPEPDINEYDSGVLRIFQSKKETKAYYNKIAGIYDLLTKRSEQPMREKGLRKLAVQPNDRILEIGFGTGHSLAQVARDVGPDGRVFALVGRRPHSSMNGWPGVFTDRGMEPENPPCHRSMPVNAAAHRTR